MILILLGTPKKSMVHINNNFSGAGGSTTNVGNVETYMIAANYSSKYMAPFVDNEYKMDYYIEDVGLNAYYYYFRMMFPFWMNSSRHNIPKEIRGQLYFFIHRQLMARYYLERMSNGLGNVEEFDWHKPIYPGYYSTLMYPNGIPVPQRNRYSSVPYYKYKYLKVCPLLLRRFFHYRQFTGYQWIVSGHQRPGDAYNGRDRLWIPDRRARKEHRHLHPRGSLHAGQRDRRKRRLLQQTILRNVRRSGSRHPWLQLRTTQQEQGDTQRSSMLQHQHEGPSVLHALQENHVVLLQVR